MEAHEDLVKNDMEDSDVQNHLNVNRAKETTFHENYGDGLLALYLIEESSISEDHPIIFRSALVLDLFGKDNRQSNLQDEYVIAHGVHDILLISANGLGMHAVSGRDQCEVSLKFPSDTIPKWKDPKTGELEGLSFDFNLCEAVATWEQVRNSTTVLTREFIDALPNGWEKYAWRRINKGVLLRTNVRTELCMEKLSLVLPDRPPYTPKQFGRCAVIGNSGDLLKTKFGKEIDSYEAIVRENGAPIDNLTEYVGTKSTLRLLNRGSAKALDKVSELYDRGKEVLLVKTTIHDIMNKMIREVPIINPVYLTLGASFGSAAKGTGLKALEFALSICDAVDMYGFTVDPGYKECSGLDIFLSLDKVIPICRAGLTIK
ncbi:Sialyltransferase-like protein 2 [Orobanche gracilis]